MSPATAENGAAQGRRAGSGLACDATGVALGRCPLVLRACAGTDAPFAVRPPQQVAAILKLAYGPTFPLALGKRLFLLHLAAQSLERGKLARARAATAALCLPEIADDTRRRNVALAGAVLKFNPYWPHQTRNRGQWGPGRLAPMPMVAPARAATQPRQAAHKTSIDWSFIRGGEGGQRLDAYPGPSLTSGATIATGVDLGQMSTDEIRHLDIAEELKQKLLPYAGKKGQAAAAYLLDNPISISKDEADQLDRAMREKLTNRLRRQYNAAVAGNPKLKQFDDLPPEAQTAMMSAEYQVGTIRTGLTPEYWKALTEQNWKKAARIIRAKPGKYAPRRQLEADLLDKIN